MYNSDPQKTSKMQKNHTDKYEYVHFVVNKILNFLCKTY